MGREKSDRRVVPKKGGNAPGGKAVTADQRVGQLDLFAETADSPKGDVAVVVRDRSRSAARAVPKSASNANRDSLAAMTMEEIAKKANLESAFESVARNRGAAGPDGRSVGQVRAHLDQLVPILRRELVEGLYQPGNVRRVWIPKSSGGRRGLGIPNVVDRWVQQAVLQVMSPHYEATFHASSHGFRPGRSCHTAIEQAKGYVKDGHEWVVDIDLKSYFDRVPHQRLLDRLARRIEDRRLLKLIHRFIRAGVVLPEGVVLPHEEGVAQGGPLSPLLSNIVLDELDWELDRRGYRFVRYADDCNIYVRSERAGQRVMASVTKFIEGRLRLEVNQSKSAVAQPKQRHFLGFRLCAPSGDGDVAVILSERSEKRLAEKIRELTPRNWGGSLASCIQQLNTYINGWTAFFGICTSSVRSELRRADVHIRRRLRALLLKQWKRRRSIVRRLIRLGVKPKSAWKALYRPKRRIWALAHRPAIDRGLRNAYFAERGLVRMEQRWEEQHAKHVVVAPAQLALPLG